LRAGVTGRVVLGGQALSEFIKYAVLLHSTTDSNKNRLRPEITLQMADALRGIAAGENQFLVTDILGGHYLTARGGS
jgi:hypothetical protein